MCFFCFFFLLLLLPLLPAATGAATVSRCRPPYSTYLVDVVCEYFFFFVLFLVFRRFFHYFTIRIRFSSLICLGSSRSRSHCILYICVYMTCIQWIYWTSALVTIGEYTFRALFTSRLEIERFSLLLSPFCSERTAPHALMRLSHELCVSIITRRTTPKRAQWTMHTKHKLVKNIHVKNSSKYFVRFGRILAFDLPIVIGWNRLRSISISFIAKNRHWLRIKRFTFSHTHTTAHTFQ